MSGRHRRFGADELGDVDIDVARDVVPGPMVDFDPLKVDKAMPQTTILPGAAVRTVVAANGSRHGALGGRRARPVVAPRPVVGSNVIARRDRAAERAARRAQARRQLLVVGAAALVLLLVAGLVVVLVTRGGGPATETAARPAVQHTLLIQVAGPDGTAAASALIGTDGSRGQAAAMLVPSRLLVDVAGAGSLPFGEALTLRTPTASADALTDLLGVRVENRWVLSTAGLAALVDKVGGVQTQVDVDVTRTDAKGNETVVVPAGSQKLKGAAAAAYATFLADGEPEQARLARFNDVLDGVVRSLPDRAAAVSADLAALGGGSSSSLTGPRLAAMLVDLRTTAVHNRVRYDVLPVNAIDTGATVDSYGVASAKASTLLDSLFAGSILHDPAGQNVRVLVENGVGVPDLVEKARARLVRVGFRFVNGGNAATLGETDPSMVLVADGTEKSQQQGMRVAHALGLPASAIATNPRGQTVADVIVILGADFRT